jgi:polysaccharide export outer membrane protein
LNDLLSSSSSSLNIDVYPGDWVTVPKAGVVYVVGAVNRSGGFVMNTTREHMTVLQAVALAEDLKPTAQREHSMIIRRELSKTGERQEIAVDLKKILAGKTPDVVMQPNDILFVPDSNGKRALRRGAEAAIQIATGLALFRM